MQRSLCDCVLKSGAWHAEQLVSSSACDATPPSGWLARREALSGPGLNIFPPPSAIAAPTAASAAVPINKPAEIWPERCTNAFQVSVAGQRPV
jgi:hypothetical protein